MCIVHSMGHVGLQAYTVHYVQFFCILCIAPTDPPSCIAPTDPPSCIAPTDPPSPDGGGCNTGAVVGGVVGGFVGGLTVASVVGAVVFIVIFTKKKKQPGYEHDCMFCIHRFLVTNIEHRGGSRILGRRFGGS